MLTSHLIRWYLLIVRLRHECLPHSTTCFYFVGISHFSNLKEVIVDNNFLSDESQFPRRKFPNIVVLSLNNNKVNVAQIETLADKCRTGWVGGSMVEFLT